MGNIISGVFYFGIYGLEEIMYFTFWTNFLDCRLKEWWKKAALVGGLACTIFCVHSIGAAQAGMALSYGIHIIIYACFSIGKIKKRLSIAFLVSTVFLFCRIILFIFNRSSTAAGPDKQFLAVMFMDLLLFMAIRNICSRSKTGLCVYNPVLTYCLSGLPVVCMIIFAGIYHSDFNYSLFNSSGLLISSGCFFLFLINVVFMSAYDKMISDIRQMNEHDILQVKHIMEQAHYERVLDIRQEYSRKLDFIAAELSAIQNMATKHHSPLIVKMAERFRQWQLQMAEESYCQDKMINIMLQEKEWLAKKSNVKFCVFVEPGFYIRHVKGSYVAAILGHIINYAIELSASCVRKYVNVQIYRANEGKFMVIEVNNSILDLFTNNRAKFSTFGIRLRYMETLVEEYGGMMLIQMADQELTSKLLFFQ